jgi:hypothetical protein
MATTFKNFLSNDIAQTRTLLHESIPITGSICSGTYGTLATDHSLDTNIKSYGHGMFSSVYDYPYLSSSANQIFDISVGVSADSNVYSSVTQQKAKKLNIYNQMAQYLVGYDHTGSIKKFQLPLATSEAQMDDVYFVPFSRLLVKDEIKKGSFSFEFSVSGAIVGGGTFLENQGTNFFFDRIKVTDASGSNGYYVDSPAGEYGVLYATSSGAIGHAAYLEGEEAGNSLTNPAAGLLYYQAGIMVLSASVFQTSDHPKGPGLLDAAVFSHDSPKIANMGDQSTLGFAMAVSGATIAQMADGLRNRIYNMSFNNTTELNSTIYFCRVAHNDFNYSSNPTYLNGSKLRVKSRASDTPVTYITTVGLYSADNELLAVAKLSEPLRKDPTNEITLRVRLDY